jgi:hypothetical protein
MPLQIVSLGKEFRSPTNVVYPPFKNGKYMEEYAYSYLLENKDKITTNYVYLPVFWTNLQISESFGQMRAVYQKAFDAALVDFASDTLFFTIVQHDDGPMLQLPKNTLVFGGCTGNIPLPLIYEDVTRRLLMTDRIEKKECLASFVGTYTTHRLRSEMCAALTNKSGIVFNGRHLWSSYISDNQADRFVDITTTSKFCLAPRGYGRSSFRFFEAIQLGCIPVYIWDDIEWLPYKDVLDYSSFAVSINIKDVGTLYDRLSSISDEKYESMCCELRRVQSYFTLEYMMKYITDFIEVCRQKQL